LSARGARNEVFSLQKSTEMLSVKEQLAVVDDAIKIIKDKIGESLEEMPGAQSKKMLDF
jgi:hypothetical protein